MILIFPQADPIPPRLIHGSGFVPTRSSTNHDPSQMLSRVKDLRTILALIRGYLEGRLSWGPVCIKPTRTKELRQLSNTEKVPSLYNHQGHTNHTTPVIPSCGRREQVQSPPERPSVSGRLGARIRRCFNEMDEVGFPTFSIPQS